MNTESPHCSKPQMHKKKPRSCSHPTYAHLYPVGLQPSAVRGPGGLAWGWGVQRMCTWWLTKQVYCLPERLLLQPLFRIFHASALL